MRGRLSEGCRLPKVASVLLATTRLGSSCAAVAAYRLGQVRSGRFEPTVWVLCTAETGLDLRALAPRHQKRRSSFEMPIHIGELDVEDHVRVRWHEARKAALAVGQV